MVDGLGRLCHSMKAQYVFVSAVSAAACLLLITVFGVFQHGNASAADSASTSATTTSTNAATAPSNDVNEKIAPTPLADQSAVSDAAAGAKPTPAAVDTSDTAPKPGATATLTASTQPAKKPNHIIIIGKWGVFNENYAVIDHGHMQSTSGGVLDADTMTAYFEKLPPPPAKAKKTTGKTASATADTTANPKSAKTAKSDDTSSSTAQAPERQLTKVIAKSHVIAMYLSPDTGHLTKIYADKAVADLKDPLNRRIDFYSSKESGPVRIESETDQTMGPAISTCDSAVALLGDGIDPNFPKLSMSPFAANFTLK